MPLLSLFLATCACLGASGCSKAARGPHSPRRPPAALSAPVALDPLTADEAASEVHVRRHVARLTRDIGERNPSKPWELAETADYIAAELEDMGLPVARSGYETQGLMALNVSVTLPGGTRGHETVVVGAHYDSEEGSVGTDVAGSVAVLLELARALRGAPLSRTTQLLFLALGESAGARGDARSSVQASREMAEGGKQVAAMISLERLGAMSITAERGKIPLTLAAGPGAGTLVALFREGLEGEPFEISAAPFPAAVDESDVEAFSSRGIPSLVLTSSPHPKSAVNSSHLARLVGRLRFAIAEVSGETRSNDGILTPGMAEVR